MRLISADWVLPIASEPVRDGAVLVDGDTIAAVGARNALEAATTGDVEREHFSGCVMMPGLVNAHTHLTLTALSGVVAPAPFHEWLPRLVAAMKPWDVADHEASGVIGAEESLACGVTVAGDIAYGAAEVASASCAGLGGVYYWELLGIPAEQIAEQLAYLRYPSRATAFGPRVVCGLSPHSPYTSGPGLLRAVAEKARELGVPLAIHVSESAAEVELLRDGTGPLAAVAGRTAFGFTAPGTNTASYLAGLGVLSGATAVHCCHLEDGDVALLASQARGVVTCPRSNRYLGNPPPRIAPLLAAGVVVGIGTDSSASNDDLDLMSEVRAIRLAEPDLPPSELLRLATAGGAEAIGVADRFGALAAGKQADVAVFATGTAADPAEAVVAHAGRASTRAVMAGGVWRVRDGRLLSRDGAAAARAADATARAREAAEQSAASG
jgi:cytosine/adenosine deaminase-related metal-dependent hydrolase